MKPNSYIAIEGLEGAGKSSALKTVEKFYKNLGREIVNVREPGGTPLAETFRNIFKDANHDEIVDVKTETMLMYGSRNQLLVNRVIPALDEGKIVLSDRSFWSSMAYQGTSPEMLKMLEMFNNYVCTVKPDIVIFMDVDPAIGINRARERGELDNIEKRKLEFFVGCRERFVKFAKENKKIYLTINANQPIEKVQEDVIKALEFHRFTYGG